MGWTAKGYAVCDSCGRERVCVEDRHMATQMLRVGGWRHMQGKTLGGQDFETILCPECVKGERKRSRSKAEGVQQELPLPWEEARVVRGAQGIQHR